MVSFLFRKRTQFSSILDRTVKDKGSPIATLISSCGFIIEIVATSTKRLVVTKCTFICTLKKGTLLLMHFLGKKTAAKSDSRKIQICLIQHAVEKTTVQSSLVRP